MKKIEDMTIPELIRAYRSAKSWIAFGVKKSDIEDLTRALDLKCEEAGIKLQNEGIEFHKLASWQMDYLTMSRPVAVFIDNAADLHALLGYLLGK